MAIRIRMSVHGCTNHRIFHLVAIDRRHRRDGKPTELLGTYDPHLANGENTKVVKWSVDRIRYWLDVGATPSKSVVKLLELGGILKPDSPYHSKAIGPRASMSTPQTDTQVVKQARSTHSQSNS
ncbi:hypothetical protein K443DRAFT_675071 [Laccaria amethystina LaAM-08-1]|uniref:Ribosomal protein S16 n=1 Tax=Laccaria amethystina LaAM-08-1 TaxID=1095629 RepID=A0A0C9X0C7_9AGAR|nr:hypothetical protein K443DRAFT_675071 [Laccaria amethystina LaAM-08-1]